MKATHEFDMRVWPNGEATVWRKRTFVPDALVPVRSSEQAEYHEALLWAVENAPGCLAPSGWTLGLSNELISDSPQSANAKGRARKGLKGISREAQRLVRNSAFILEQRYGIARLAFATCTVPPLPSVELSLIHKNWSSVLEHYRRNLRRALISSGLRGESVIVSEIQQERSDREGRPILHLHASFCGRCRNGRWALTTAVHDEIWRSALSSVLENPLPALPYSCNIQRVRKSVQGYLGKYMTKGSSAIAHYCALGYEDWLPAQWHSLSRSLRAAVIAEICRPTGLADIFLDDGLSEKPVLWEHCGAIYLPVPDAPPYFLALSGRLHLEYLSSLRRVGRV